MDVFLPPPALVYLSSFDTRPTLWRTQRQSMPTPNPGGARRNRGIRKLAQRTADAAVTV